MAAYEVAFSDGRTDRLVKVEAMSKREAEQLAKLRARADESIICITRVPVKKVTRQLPEHIRRAIG